MSERLTRRGLLGVSVGSLAAGGLARAARAADRPIPADILPIKGPRKFKLGLCTYNIAPDWDVPTLIDRCRQLGLAAVELRTTHKHGVEPTLGKAERQEVKKRFADSGVLLWTLGSVCEFHSPDPAVVAKNIEDSKRFIELAADVGARTVKVRPNGLPKEVDENKTLEQIGRSLQAVGEAAAAAGVQICVEMHGGGTSDPARMRRIMDIANHSAVGVTWNSNPGDVKDGSIGDGFDLMKRWIFGVHINELTNGYPYRELFTRLRGIGYDRFTMIEAQNFKTPNPDPADVMRFVTFYKALWEELSREN